MTMKTLVLVCAILSCVAGSLPGNPLYRSNGPLYRSNGPLYGSNGPLYGSNGPLYGSNGPLYGSNGPLYGSNGPLYRSADDPCLTDCMGVTQYDNCYTVTYAMTGVVESYLSNNACNVAYVQCRLPGTTVTQVPTNICYLLGRKEYRGPLIGRP